jgi:hypothetical protein
MALELLFMQFFFLLLAVLILYLNRNMLTKSSSFKLKKKPKNTEALPYQ